MCVLSWVSGTQASEAYVFMTRHRGVGKAKRFINELLYDRDLLQASGVID